MNTKSPAFRDLGATLTLLGLGLSACDSRTEPMVNQATAAVPDSAVARLQGMRVFFGHQSVGGNIVAGIEGLTAAGLALPLAVVRTDNVDSVAGGVLAHQWIGENGNPSGKMAAFRQLLSAPSSHTVNTAMMKLCYSDFAQAADPRQLFSEYVVMVDALQAERPDVVLAHVTTPLVAPDGAMKLVVRTLRGRLTNRERNRRIQQYNDLMRARYGASGRVFDLASLESGGAQAPTALLSSYTDDGEHLNAAGQRVVAAAYIAFLGRLNTP